jgi:hypothetical protein
MLDASTRWKGRVCRLRWGLQQFGMSRLVFWGGLLDVEGAISMALFQVWEIFRAGFGCSQDRRAVIQGLPGSVRVGHARRAAAAAVAAAVRQWDRRWCWSAATRETAGRAAAVTAAMATRRPS